ncbi:hypothetical protein [Curtobacterium sp. 260]|uniref:hypothetical protein n=1 Tax=Curtobacterium sp. 260 TaxID=2817748 RepID=UPI0027888F90|nr:hypothetical protein [Curtobacterium sp. 260]MDP9738100.1 hypothetical protein [Curtobacterium sp. 260]
MEHLPTRTSVHVVRAQMRTGGSLEAARWVGLGLVVSGVLLTVVGSGLVALLGALPIVGGGGLYLVATVRWWDLAVDTALAIGAQDDRSARTPAWRPTVSVADVRSARRGALWLGASLSVLALVAGVGSWAIPTLEPDRPQAVLQDAAAEPLPMPTPTTTSTPTGGAPRGARGLPVAPFAVERGAVRIAQFDEEDAWAAVCEAAMGDSDCLAWGIVASIECDLHVTIGFADSETGPVTRTQERSVRVRPGTPAFLASVASEQWSGIEAAGCRPRPEIDDHVATWFPTQDHEAQPEGCWSLGCIGFDLIPDRDCPSADVQFSVFDDYGRLGNPHDLVVSVDLHADEPLTVWAGGVESFEGDAVLTRISCVAAPDDDSTPSSIEGVAASRTTLGATMTTRTSSNPTSMRPKRARAASASTPSSPKRKCSRLR